VDVVAPAVEGDGGYKNQSEIDALYFGSIEFGQ